MNRTLLDHTVKELRDIAKEKQIIGRWDMDKSHLIAAIQESDRLGMEYDHYLEDPDPIIYEENELEEDVFGDLQVVEDIPAKDTKARYRNNAEIGTLIAFYVGPRLMTAMIKTIKHNDLIVETKRGSKFTVNKENVIWFKTGERWPKFIYQELKGKRNDNQENHSQAKNRSSH